MKCVSFPYGEGGVPYNPARDVNHASVYNQKYIYIHSSRHNKASSRFFWTPVGISLGTAHGRIARDGSHKREEKDHHRS